MPIRFTWLFDFKTDLAFFFAPVFAAALLFALLQNGAIASSALLSFAILQGLGLGPFHTGVTWTHLADKEVRDHLLSSGRRRVLILLLMLSGVAASSIGMLINPLLVLAVYMASSVHHIVQQNAGILLLYHNHGKEVAVRKELEVGTLHAAAVFCSVVFLWRFAVAGTWQHFAFGACTVGTLLWVGIATWNFLSEVRRQSNEGLPVNGSSLLFWALAMGFFLPLAFLGKNYNQALLMPLVMHWFQYIGLNWILFKRKDRQSGFCSSPVYTRRLIVISMSWTAFLLLLGTLAEPIYAISPTLQSLLAGMFMGLVMLHYIQDAFLWKLRDPFLRQRLLPYLKPQEVSTVHGAQETPVLVH
jgi:hypothetical protein